MRKSLIVVCLAAVVVLAGCSSGGGGGDSYTAPNMGTVADLPAAAYSAPVATADAGLTLLDTAMRDYTTLVTTTTKHIPAAKALSTVDYSEHLAYSGALTGVTATGGVDISVTGIPTGTPSNGDVINCTSSVKQTLTVTLVNVSTTQSGSTYTLNGKMLCNGELNLKIAGTYPAITTSGSLKTSYGLAGTIDDTTHSVSAKFILSVGGECSLDTMGSYPLTATLYVYTPDNNLIGTVSLTPGQLGVILPMPTGMDD